MAVTDRSVVSFGAEESWCGLGLIASKLMKLLVVDAAELLR